LAVAVYGATGLTGRLVLSELESLGTPSVIVGRDTEALAELERDHDNVGEARPARLDDPARLRASIDGCEVVVNCAGAIGGEALIEAALDARAGYADAAGEQWFIRTVFERYDQAARAAGVSIVPALGFDYAIGDCIARLAAEGYEPLRELVIAYALSGSGVSGDALSAPAGERRDELIYRDGEWRPAAPGIHRASFGFPPPLGRQPMQRYGSGEVITVPRHTATARVTTLITASSWAPHPALAGLIPYLRPLAAGLRHSSLRGVLRLAARSGAGVADPQRDREAARFVIAALAHGEDGSVGRGLVEGADFYGLTAATLAEGARLLAGDGAAGVHSAATAFEPASFLDSLSRWLSWRVE
jgi:short subunit dehydrogenase-like uncharacterized protein